MSRHDDIPSASDLDAQAQRVMRDNQARFSKQFEIQDGKLFGFIPVAPELERTVNLVIGPLTAGIAGNIGNFAERMTQKALKTDTFKDVVKDKVFAGKAAKTGAIGLVMLARPLAEGYAFVRDRAAGFIEVSRETSRIADDVGATKDNKVMALAYRKYNESWGSDIKRLIPGWLLTASMVPHAMKEYDKIWPESALWKSEAAAVEKKLTQKQVMEKWQEERRNLNYQDPEDIKLAREHFFEQHGHSVNKSTGSNQSHGNQSFNIEDVFTGKISMGMGLPALAGFFAPDVEKWARRDDKKKVQPNSLELIEALHERVKNGSAGNMHKAVMDIFEQFEKDMGHKPFESPMLAERTEVISKAIASGRMSARGLIRLVGEDMVVEHHGNSREIKSAEDITKAVEMVAVTTLSKSSEMSKDKFMGRFERQAIVEQTIKQNLIDFKEGPERDLFISVIPIEVLEGAGLSKNDIREARVRAQQNVYDNVAAGVLHLASLDEETLQKGGMTFKEIQYLQGISKRVMDGDVKMLHELVDNKKEGLANLVAAGLLAEQTDKDKPNAATWTERVKQGGDLKNTLEKIKAEKQPRHAPNAEAEGHGHAHPGKDHAPQPGHRGIEHKSLTEHARRDDGQPHVPGV